jgi:hypothetical protein
VGGRLVFGDGRKIGQVKQAKIALLLVLLLSAAPVPAVQAQDICADPNNLTFNCQFDTFDHVEPYGAVASGWTAFVEFAVQPPAFNSAGETPLAPAQEIFSAWLPYTAGIYQQVQVTPGVAYVAAIGWAAYASYDNEGRRNSGSFIGRKVGIDPFGGTDYTSPSIVWSPEVWDETGGVFPQLRVSAVAQAPTITVFVRAHNPQSHGNDKVWFDAVSLKVDPTQPTVTPTPMPPSPTPTSPPPTPTSTPLPPTDTPAPTDTPTPIATDTPTPTSSPTAMQTATPTATPTGTPEATLVPASAPTEAPTPTPTPRPQPDRSAWIPNILLGVAVLSFIGVGILGGTLILLRRS